MLDPKCLAPGPSLNSMLDPMRNQVSQTQMQTEILICSLKPKNLRVTLVISLLSGCWAKILPLAGSWRHKKSPTTHHHFHGYCPGLSYQYFWCKDFFFFFGAKTSKRVSWYSLFSPSLPMTHFACSMIRVILKELFNINPSQIFYRGFRESFSSPSHTVSSALIKPASLFDSSLPLNLCLAHLLLSLWSQLKDHFL